MLRAFLFALFLPLAAIAQGLPEPMSDRINDFADLMPPEAEARVAEMLQRGREETGVHVVVVTMERMAQNGGVGEPITDYAKRLFNAWGIGDKDRDDGILILVARTDREMRIALGAGYPVIWDNAAQRVIDRYMLPDFKEDRYAEGIEAGVAATFELIARPYTAGAAAPEEEPWTPEDALSFAIFGVFGLMAAASFLRGRLGDLLTRLRACPNCGHRSQRRWREVINPASRAAAGEGVTHYHCDHCGIDRSERYVIPRRSSSGSSGSSGFGGGSSSGGGASGRW